MKKEHYVLSIRAEDRLGLLHLLSGVIEKRLIKIISLSFAPTDIHGIILITAEVKGHDSLIAQLAFKLENIIEVFAVEATYYNESVCLRAAYFKIRTSFLETAQAAIIAKYGANVLQFYKNAFLLAKYGTDATIRSLYHELDGPHLLGFSQTGLITDTQLISEDQSSVIRQAA